MYISTNEATCEEIKKVLDAQGEKPQNIRVAIAGMSCSGPSFGLGLDDVKETDYTEEINGINFVIQKDIFDSMGEILVSYAGSGYVVRPVIQPESACGSCAGSCG